MKNIFILSIIILFSTSSFASTCNEKNAKKTALVLATMIINQSRIQNNLEPVQVRDIFADEFEGNDYYKKYETLGDVEIRMLKSEAKKEIERSLDHRRGAYVGAHLSFYFYNESLEAKEIIREEAQHFLLLDVFCN